MQRTTVNEKRSRKINIMHTDKTAVFRLQGTAVNCPRKTKNHADSFLNTISGYEQGRSMDDCKPVDCDGQNRFLPSGLTSAPRSVPSIGDSDSKRSQALGHDQGSGARPDAACRLAENMCFGPCSRARSRHFAISTLAMKMKRGTAKEARLQSHEEYQNCVVHHAGAWWAATGTKV
jgi:hypothetical protein